MAIKSPYYSGFEQFLAVLSLQSWNNKKKELQINNNKTVGWKENIFFNEIRLTFNKSMMKIKI